MKTRKRSGGELRQTVASMVTNTAVLERVAGQWEDGGLFDARWANLAGRWCVDFFKAHGKAPGQTIRSQFDEWASTTKVGEETIEGVERFLAYLSDEHERRGGPPPTDHLLGVAERYFNRVRVKRLAETIDDEYNGKIDKQIEAVMGFKPVDLRGGADGLVPLSDVERRKVSWLWRDWVPRGELTIIDGDMGSGKSQITLDIAARVSRGWRMPPGCRNPFDRDRRKPANVILLSSEDDAATTIGPRFDVAGGDSNRARVLGVGGGDRPPMMFPDGLPSLEKMIVKHRARLVVVDPFYGFLSGKVDANTDHKVRGPLRMLSDMAHRTGAAFILTRHLNKKEESSPLYRGGGSVAVAAHCPSALILGRDPENRETRIMAGNRIKHAPMPPSLGYGIEGRDHPETGRLSRIEWTGETELTADDILRCPKRQGRPSRMDEYVEFIRDTLADGRTMTSRELQKAVTAEFDISVPTYKTARKLANVEVEKEGFSGGWICRIDG